MSGMRDISKAAGVSLSTVSAVLGSGSKYVSEDTRKKVLQSAEELGYVPKSRKSEPYKNVIVMTNGNHIANDPFALLQFKEAVEDEETNLCVYCIGHSYESEKRYLRMIPKGQMRAIVDFTMCPVSQLEDYCSWLKSEFVSVGIPVLIIAKKVEVPGIVSISVNNEMIGYEATRHLLQKGHRKIVCLLGRNGSNASLERYNGYCRALREYDLPVDPNLVVNGNYSSESGEDSLRHLLQGKVDFTAVFSANDDMAIGAVKAIKEAGKRIPGDIAIIGVDGTYASGIMTPALSTVDIPVPLYWQTIADCIHQLARGECPAEHYSIQHVLIERESTGPVIR